jgi:hypothetical protein
LSQSPAIAHSSADQGAGQEHYHVQDKVLSFAMLPLARTCAWRTTHSSVKRTSITSPLSSSVLARLASTLAILEQREGKLNDSSLGAITAAQKIGGPIHGFVAGPKSVAETAAKVKGLEKVLMVDNAAYDKVGHPQPFPTENQPKQKLIPLFYRGCQKTSPRYWSKTSRREGIRMSSLAIQHLGRISCPG